jgi:hypothetical protein
MLWILFETGGGSASITAPSGERRWKAVVCGGNVFGALALACFAKICWKSQRCGLPQRSGLKLMELIL